MKTVLFVLVLFGFNDLARAQGSCEGHTKPATGCMLGLRDLQREQAELDQIQEGTDLKGSLKSLFREIDGKLLSYTHPWAGRYTVKITMGSSAVDVQMDGRPAEDAEICFRVCPGTKRVSWFNKKRGEFKKISGGLSIGGYPFKIVKD